MPGGAPEFYMFPRSHGDIYFLRNEKKVRKSKESCLRKGSRFHILVRSPEVWEHPRAHILGCPSLKRAHF